MRITLLLLALALPATAQAQTKALPKNHGKEALAIPPGEPGPSSRADLSRNDPALVTLMDQIEAKVALPEGVAIVSHLSRSYAWADREHRMVTAIYRPQIVAGRSWVEFEDLPAILGGGCRVVTVIWDTRLNTAHEVTCNQP